MLHDLRYALRRVRRRPGHSGLVAATLGLGLGAALAAFGAVDAILLRPLPFDDASRLVRISQVTPVDGLPEIFFSDVGFRRLLSDSKVLDGAAAYNDRDLNLVRDGRSERVVVQRVTRSMFNVLRLRPALGRTFSEAEDTPNGPRAVVLSDWLWRSSFGADTGIIGTQLDLEGTSYTVVGVLPAGMAFPWREVAMWEPAQIDPAMATPFQFRFAVIGRLRDGVSLEAAQVDLTAPIRAVGREYPSPHPGTPIDPANFSARVRSLATVVAGDTRGMALLLVAAVGGLLLLTCANVANLQLAAALTRQEEIAVRTALGASRTRMIGGAALEGIILAAAGAALGIALAQAGAGLMSTLLPLGVSAESAAFGVRAMVATLVLVVVAGAAVGALPMVAMTAGGTAQSLRLAGSGSAGASSSTLRRSLAAAQVALAVVLLHGAGLLVASAREVAAVKLGFRTEGTLAMRLNMPASVQRDRAAREVLLRRLVDGVTRLPGVNAVGIASTLPLTNGPRDQAMAVEGRPFKADGTDPLADIRVVSAGYFEAMGIPLRAGRTFGDDDATDRITPIVINEAHAKQLFPDGENPVGRRLKFGPVAPWMPIVAVVGDAKNRGLAEPSRPEIYFPALGSWATQTVRSGMSLIVRASGDPAAFAPTLRRVIADAAPEVAVVNARTMDEVVRVSRARMSTMTRLMTSYAVAALVLAIAGTYAVLSFLVAQRRRELALRVALGAAPAAIVRLVMRESLLVTGLGVLVGIAGAIASGRLMTGLLYGVGTLDVGVTGGVIVGAAIAGIVAGVIPAWRAVRSDPCAPLRGGT
jgi:putative ABC transport system permease protein